jgi:hypothetical protein
VRNYFVRKKSFRKDLRIIFLEAKFGFKRNHIKRQGQSCGATGPAHWKKGSRHWVGAGMRDEMKKINNNKKYIYRLTAGNLTKSAKGIYKKVSNVHNLIFKQNLFKFK